MSLIFYAWEAFFIFVLYYIFARPIDMHREENYSGPWSYFVLVPLWVITVPVLTTILFVVRLAAAYHIEALWFLKHGMANDLFISIITATYLCIILRNDYTSLKPDTGKLPPRIVKRRFPTGISLISRGVDLPEPPSESRARNVVLGVIIGGVTVGSVAAFLAVENHKLRADLEERNKAPLPATDIQAVDTSPWVKEPWQDENGMWHDLLLKPKPGYEASSPRTEMLTLEELRRTGKLPPPKPGFGPTPDHKGN